MITRHKLGKKAARKGAVRFQLSDYVDLSKLPAPRLDFGRRNLITDWNMLKNDQCGDCVFASAAHSTMLARKEAGIYYDFSDGGVESDYSALTGFDPSKTDESGYNPTDQGTDMQQAAEYRRTVGVVDSLGWRHRVLGYVSINPGSLDQLYAAANIFTDVEIGIRFPQSAMEQFDQGVPWSVVPGSPIEGGHCVPIIDRGPGLIHIATWAKTQAMEEAFYQEYCDEVIVYLTIENLIRGKTLEGFDLPALLADLGALKPVPNPNASSAGWPWDKPEQLGKILSKGFSSVTQAIDALPAKLQKPKTRVFVIGFGRDEPINKR